MTTSQANQTLLDLMLVHGGKAAANMPRGVGSAQAKIDYDLLMAQYLLKQELRRQGLSIEAQYLQKPAECVQAKRMSIQPTTGATSGSPARLNAKIPHESAGRSSAMSQLAQGHEAARLTVESTQKRHTLMKQLNIVGNYDKC